MSILEIKNNINIVFEPGKQLLCNPRLLLGDTQMLLTSANSISDLEKELEDNLKDFKTSTGFDTLKTLWDASNVK